MKFKEFFYQILEEGGAAGHIAHPFEIDWVNTGNSLLKVFKLSVLSLENQRGVVKVDGINTSFKIVKRNGLHQFALDRGSNIEQDILGITQDEQEIINRFGSLDHHFAVITKNLLKMLNSTIKNSEVINALKKLKLYNNENLIINCEYVLPEKTNVIEYGDRKYLILHNVLESKFTTLKKRNIQIADYKQEDLDQLATALNKILHPNFGFTVVSKFDATFKSKPNFSKVLMDPVTIKPYKDRDALTVPLASWLAEITIPKNQKVFLNGKKTDAISKWVYTTVLNAKTSLQELGVENAEQLKHVIAGFITYHATRLLGQEILNNLTSDLGDLKNQEGVVINDSSISKVPFKITGDFILKGMKSSFSSTGL